MSEKKARELFVTEEDRKVWIDSIRVSVEQSLQTQVRAALGTPPDAKKKRQRAKKQREQELQNSSCSSKEHSLNSKERSYSYLNGSDDRFKYDRDKLRYDDESSPRTINGLPSLYVDPLSDEYNQYFSPYTRAALENVAFTSSSQYTPPAHKTIEQSYERGPADVWIDCQGKEHEIPGPFWPKDHLPLYSNQKHIDYVPICLEPLNSTGTRGIVKEDDGSLFPKQWRGATLVYDRSNSKLCPTAPTGCFPNLKFESRFECGNLQQAKRVGRCEYDLMLKPDLYSKRHTQWYYFRVENMVCGVTYKFNIVNLLKRDSLYNYGMKPLLYSQKLADHDQTGWKRAGHSISYSKNVSSKHPLMAKDLTYFVLSFQMEFAHSGDVCYLAHCYPYSYSDLELYLRTLVDSPTTSQHVRKEFLCKTLAGNKCHMLTITSSQVPDNKKLGVVISARVHPGETNASWMMKGVMDYLTSNDAVAESLRQKFVFKIVPMLNPDGVIVGNYRTNLAAKDLNRTFKEPDKDNFPTVWHTKAMLESFKENHQVIIYCDLHGHSRKPNVFMYGCTADPRMGSVSNFLEERLFPWMMSQKAPDKFSFQGCKFIVRKCKESTARVVMWRQLGIMNSFTMEATFCGANFGDMEKGRHFNTHDFEDMGRHFCEVLMEYSEAKSANRNEMTQAFIELACKMTRDILRQSLGSFKQPSEGDIANKQQPLKSNEKKAEETESEKLQFVSSVKHGLKFAPTAKDVNFVDVDVRQVGNRKNSEMTKNGGDYEVAVKSIHVDSFNDCVKILEGLGLTKCYEESDSSDSDSEPEDSDEMYSKKGSNKTTPENTKDKIVEEEQATPEEVMLDDDDDDDEDDGCGGDITMHGDDDDDEDDDENAVLMVMMMVVVMVVEIVETTMRKVKTSFTKFVNPYTNRFNNGIPVYSQERMLERARKKEQEKEAEEKVEIQVRVSFYRVVFQPTDVSTTGETVIAFTNDTELNFVTAQRRLTYYMMNRHHNKSSNYVRSVSNPNLAVLPNHMDAPHIESFKMDHLENGGYGFAIRFPVKRTDKREIDREIQTYARPASLQSFEEARSFEDTPAFVEVDPHDLYPNKGVADKRTTSVFKGAERNRENVAYGDYAKKNDRNSLKDLETMLRLVNQTSRKGFDFENKYKEDLLEEFDKLNIRGRRRHPRLVPTPTNSTDKGPSINNRSTVDLRTPFFPSYLESKWSDHGQENDGSPKFESQINITSYSSVGFSSPTTTRRHIYR
ncbi:hypothetical protein QZH41_011997 [Actinostola sp. cb2023]|nr:hypothetical protein QZH41_011997 [Actinostola sp. cb2023]